MALPPQPFTGRFAPEQLPIQQTRPKQLFGLGRPLQPRPLLQLPQQNDPRFITGGPGMTTRQLPGAPLFGGGATGGQNRPPGQNLPFTRGVGGVPPQMGALQGAQAPGPGVGPSAQPFGNIFGPGGPQIPGMAAPQAPAGAGQLAGVNPALAGLDPNLLRSLSAQGITSQAPQAAASQLSLGGDGTFADVPRGFTGLVEQFQNAPGGFNQQAFQQEIESRGFASRLPVALGGTFVTPNQPPGAPVNQPPIGGQPPGAPAPGVTPSGFTDPSAPGTPRQDVLPGLRAQTDAQAARFGGAFAGEEPVTGVIGAEQALRGGFEGGISSLLGGLQELREGTEAGAGELSAFAEPGQQAAGVRAALSGALGPEAQQQAISDFQDSPGQQFLRERGERSILRNQAATGGLGGGNVLRELQREGIGLAAQDFGNAFGRLGEVSGEGLGAAGQIANLLASQGQGGLQAGFQGSNLFQNIGSQLAGGRTGAGQQIAGAIGGTTSALADLINQQGGDISGILGGAGSNLANLLAGAGGQQGASNQQLAALLANLATGQGSQVAGLPGIPGTQQGGGILGSLGGLAGGIGGLLAGL